MGGFGSGERTNKKMTVEACLQLDASLLIQQGAIRQRGICRGELSWSNSVGRILSVRYSSQCTAEERILCLTAKVEADGSEQPLLEPIVLTSTATNFGGQRWWFVCPLRRDGVACKRRVRKLYLPPGAEYFGCRTCYDLTYESAQSNDDRINRLMKNPTDLVSAFNSGDLNERLRACRAYIKVFDLL
jgi:hypothetical protein